jgi:hypothetical protein
MKQVIRYLGILCLGGAAFAGCAADDVTPVAPSASELDSSQVAAAQDDAQDDVQDDVQDAPAAARAVRLRFVHGSPQSPAFDVYTAASTTPLFTAVGFGTATPYAVVSPDGLQLVLRTAGAAPTDAPVYTSDVVTAQPGDTITSIAGGLLGSTAAATRFRVQPYTEAFAAPERRQAVVRFVHDSHALPAAGFDVDADGTIEVPSVAAFTASDAAGIAVTRSHRDVQLAIDTGSPAKQLTSFTLPHQVLRQRRGIFLALVGVPAFVPHDSRGLALLAVGRETTTLIRQNPTVYVLAAVPDGTAVDVFAIGHSIGVQQPANDLAFGALAPALQVAPTDRGYALIVSRSAASGGALSGFPLAFDSTGPLVAGERYLAVVSGFAAPGRSRVHVTIEHEGFDRTVTANGRMCAVAASPDAPAVDVGRFPPGTGTPFTAVTGLENLVYRQASAEAGVEVSAAPLNPGVRVTGAASAQRFRFGALLATDRVFGVVTGAFAPIAGDVATSFIVVKTPPTGSWTASTAVPQL